MNVAKVIMKMLGGKNILLKMIRVILEIIVIFLSGYSLITKDFDLMPYSLLCLGAFMLATGIAEFQKERPGFSMYGCIVVSLFMFYVSIQWFLIK